MQNVNLTPRKIYSVVCALSPSPNPFLHSPTTKAIISTRLTYTTFVVRTRKFGWSSLVQTFIPVLLFAPEQIHCKRREYLETQTFFFFVKDSVLHRFTWILGHCQYGDNVSVPLSHTEETQQLDTERPERRFSSLAQITSRLSLVQPSFLPIFNY